VDEDIGRAAPGEPAKRWSGPEPIRAQLDLMAAPAHRLVAVDLEHR
jgi:hypothetical protein